jgi:hypothetical protein
MKMWLVIRTPKRGHGFARTNADLTYCSDRCAELLFLPINDERIYVIRANLRLFSRGWLPPIPVSPDIRCARDLPWAISSSSRIADSIRVYQHPRISS